MRDLDTWTGIEFDARKSWTPYVFVGAWGRDAGHSSGHWFQPSVDFRVSSRFSASLGANYDKSVNDHQWVGNFGDIGVDTMHYTFAHLDQQTLGLTSRMNFTASPTLSFQVYAQPFMTTGKYSNWREPGEPARGALCRSLQAVRGRRSGWVRLQAAEIEHGRPLGIPAGLNALLRLAAGTRALERSAERLQLPPRPEQHVQSASEQHPAHQSFVLV